MSNSEQELLTSECLLENINQVEKLLQKGIDPNFNCASFISNDLTKAETLLGIAVLKGNLEITKLLIAHGANVNYRCKHGESALFLAVCNGHLKISESLLKAGAKVAYTAKCEGNVFLENWEVFTQALKNVYPQNINDPSHSDYKAVIQLLLEYNANSPRPSTLYEVLYCSLTVFSNPIAVYCVGVYAELSSSHPTVVFSEDNFLSALCHAFDFSHVLDFLSTVQSILHSNKARQKDAAQSLVRHFNWSDLVRRVAERFSQHHKPPEEAAYIARKLFSVFNLIASNFNVRSAIQEQFAALNNDSMGKIGRLIKFVLDLQANADRTCSPPNLVIDDQTTLLTAASNIRMSDAGSSSAMFLTETWQFLFFLLKQYLRDGQKNLVARLLLRPNGYKEANSANAKSFGSDFEKKVLIKCVEEDISLAHMLLDYGVVISGDCFVNFVKHGHVDLVDRCANDKELLFCKEVCQLFQSPIVSVKNASNRNMRRCIKIIKNQRNAIEKAQIEVEEELLLKDTSSSKISKKKQKQRARRLQNGGFGDGMESKENETVESSLEQNGVPESINEGCKIDSFKSESFSESHLLDPIQESTSPDSNGIDHFPYFSTSPTFSKQFSTEDSEGTDDHNDAGFDKTSISASRSKPKKRKKNKKHHPRNKFSSISEASSDEKNDDFCSDNNHPENEEVTSDTWKELMLASSQRRRRQSSSSSDCSTGPRKSVHFSHPLTFYENNKAKCRLRKVPSFDVPPKASNLKQTVSTDQNFDISEAYRTSQNGFFNCADFDANIPWVPQSVRWSARFEDLSETEIESLKVMSMNGTKSDLKLYFCDKQKHLNVGSGPDFSSNFLGLTSQGKEVAIKRIGKKRLPLLTANEEIEGLLKLEGHTNINQYHAVLKDKVHFFIIQDVAEYSLDQAIRKKIIVLPLSVQEACEQIGKGLQYLHNNNILHMNLKPNNVLLGVDNKLRLSDYGIHRREHSEDKRNPLGPTLACQCWMARESAAKGKTIFSQESDIQCLGMLFHYVITGGGHPFGNPDSMPGDCVKNISKGTCNLSSLNDPFSHDMVKNMLAKEAQKRSSILEVLSHPFFWSNEDKDAYFSLLIKSTLSGGITEDGQSFLKILEKFRHGIMMTYSRKDMVENASEDKFASVESLVQLIRSCLNNPDTFKHHAKSELITESSSSSSYFRSAFPGFLIQAYKVITWDDLEIASPEAEIALLTQDNCDYECNNLLANEDSVIKTILGITQENDGKSPSHNENLRCESAPSIINTPPNSESDFLPPSVYVGSANGGSEINNDLDDPEVFPQALKENSFGEELNGFDSLPLLEESGPFVDAPPREKVTSLPLIPDSGKLDAEDDFSPSHHDDNILLDCEWNSYSKQHAFAGKPEEMIFHPSCNQNDIHATSPDDWIDVGSPIFEPSGKLGSSAPVDLRKGPPGALDDNNSAGSSSSCSVDGCYDFDSYIQNWPGSPDALLMKDPSIFPSNLTSSLHSGYTDIDELD